MSPFLCSCLGKLPLTNTFVAHTLSVGYLPTCPSVEMAVCLIPGPRASSSKPRCQPPVSHPAGDFTLWGPFPSPPLKSNKPSSMLLPFSSGSWQEAPPPHFGDPSLGWERLALQTMRPSVSWDFVWGREEVVKLRRVHELGGILLPALHREEHNVK